MALTPLVEHHCSHGHSCAKQRHKQALAQVCANASNIAKVRREHLSNDGKHGAETIRNFGQSSPKASAAQAHSNQNDGQRRGYQSIASQQRKQVSQADPHFGFASIITECSAYVKQSRCSHDTFLSLFRLDRRRGDFFAKNSCGQCSEHTGRTT